MEPKITKVKLSGPFRWAAEAPAWMLGGLLGPKNFRFVGGAVRDALLERKVTDIDIATIFEPEEIITRLEGGNFKAIPTGLAHGTVTGIVKGQTFEFTTLREDVETYGRHARVEFHDDWLADARRRDFTINALYLDLDGTLYDYFGGQRDLEAGVVKFIGDPGKRIREDALRILRFFRFHAWYGKGEMDKAALTTIKENLSTLKPISKERYQTEILKTLRAANPGPVFKTMLEIGVLEVVFSNLKPDLTKLENLVSLENELARISAIRRLGVLFLGKGDPVSDALKLSNKDRARLNNLKPLEAFSGEPKKLRALAYRLGKDTLVDCLMISLPGANEAKEALSYLEGYDIPKFPVSGKDLEAIGMKPGIEMGNHLKTLEEKWIKSDFKLAKKELLKF